MLRCCFSVKQQLGQPLKRRLTTPSWPYGVAWTEATGKPSWSPADCTVKGAGAHELGSCFRGVADYRN